MHVCACACAHACACVCVRVRACVRACVWCMQVPSEARRASDALELKLGGCELLDLGSRRSSARTGAQS